MQTKKWNQCNFNSNKNKTDNVLYLRCGISAIAIPLPTSKPPTIRRYHFDGIFKSSTSDNGNTFEYLTYSFRWNFKDTIQISFQRNWLKSKRLCNFFMQYIVWISHAYLIMSTKNKKKLSTNICSKRNSFSRKTLLTATLAISKQ